MTFCKNRKRPTYRGFCCFYDATKPRGSNGESNAKGIKRSQSNFRVNTTQNTFCFPKLSKLLDQAFSFPLPNESCSSKCYCDSFFKASGEKLSLKNLHNELQVRGKIQFFHIQFPARAL